MPLERGSDPVSIVTSFTQATRRITVPSPLREAVARFSRRMFVVNAVETCNCKPPYLNLSRSACQACRLDLAT